MTTLPRRGLLGLALGCLAATGPVRADDGADIRQPIVNLYRALEAAMRAGRATPFRQRFNALAPVIDRVFDLETILQVSVGLRWPSIDPAAKTALFDAFRRFTVATYVANFDNYEGEKLEVLPDLRSIGEDRVVHSRVTSSSSETVRLDYVMRSSSAGWRVVDVLLDGTISRVAVQRSDFRALLGRGDPTALLESLRRKTIDLSGGALAS